MSPPRSLPAAHVIVVCTANAIRSPFVENLLRQRLAEKGVERVELESAGTAARSGLRAEPGARSLALAMGFSLEEHRTRPLGDRMLRSGTVVLCAERAHRRVVLGMRPDLVATVFTVREFARLAGAARSTSAVATWPALLSAVSRARVLDRHVDQSEDDIVDPIGQGHAVWADFERSATSAVDAIVEATSDLFIPSGTGHVPVGPMTRREYRESTRTPR
ncbi:MAG: protein-tyrosine-phosphatase [Microbacterium sp.]|nr:protein-tyrosine-phosphatase [Microbacterium sp.]